MNTYPVPFLRNLPTPLIAAILLTIGISIMGLSDNLVRLVSEDIGLGQYHFLRSALSIALFLMMRGFVSFRLQIINWRPVLLRTLFLSLSMTLFFSVLSFLPVALAGVGAIYLSCFCVALFCCYISNAPWMATYSGSGARQCRGLVCLAS